MLLGRSGGNPAGATNKENANNSLKYKSNENCYIISLLYILDV